MSGCARDAKDPAAGFGSGDEILVGIEGQNANVRFIAGVEKFTLAIGGYSEELPLISRGHIKRAIGTESQVPDVFRFRIEENRLFAGSGNFVNLAVGRSAHIKRAFGIESNGLRGEVRGIENNRRLGVRIEAKDLRLGTACSIQNAFRIKPHGEKVRSVGIGKQGEFRRQFEAAVTAHGNPMSCALEQIFIRGLTPAARVLCEKWRRGNEVKKYGEREKLKKAARGE